MVTRAKAALIQQVPNAAAATLAHSHTFRLPNGSHVVRFAQERAGLPVIGRGAAVLVDPAGAPTKLAVAKLDARAPTSVAPTVDLLNARTTAQASAGIEFRASDAKLAYWPTRGSTDLVWVFQAEAGNPLPYSPVVLVDARSGRIRLQYNSVVFDRAASVYEFNPVKTPTLKSVTLDTLPAGATTLTTERVVVKNCVDRQTVKQVFNRPIHSCELEQLAQADANGDFTAAFSSDTAPDDAFAEVTMFYHMSKAYSYFTGLGLTEIETKPLPAIVNLRMTAGFQTFDATKMSDPTIPLVPYDNAFYAGSNPIFSNLFGLQGAALWFGQGNVIDFAYDGDVVYHEFGHAVVDQTARLVGHYQIDEQGAIPAAGSMNEGIADYFSSAIAGDPDVGEYAGKSFRLPNIRSIENDDSCPLDISSEVHADSTHFSAALWSARQSLPEADRKNYDAAILAGLMTVPSGDIMFDGMAEVFVSSLTASPLGAPAASALSAELSKRAILPKCRRVREFTGTPIRGGAVTLAYSFYASGRRPIPLPDNAPYAPGPFQVHVPLEPNTTALRVEMRDIQAQGVTGGGGGGQSVPYTPAILVRFGAEPISFNYEPELTSNALEPATMTKTGVRYSAEVPVTAGASEAYVMIVNMGDANGLYTDLTFMMTQGEPEDAGGAAGAAGAAGTPSEDAGISGTAGTATAAPTTQLEPKGGCTCRSTGGRAEFPNALALAGLLTLFFRRRQRKVS